MQVKKDTKEKFTVYIPENGALTANMAELLISEIRQGMSHIPPHVILNLRNIHTADSSSIQQLLALQQHAYEKHISFVICHASKEIEPFFEDCLNLVPTESEAWDIVQMEEIERELLDFDEDHSN